MKIFVICIVFLLSCLAIFAQDSKLYKYYPDFIKDESLSGFVDVNGKIVIPAEKYADIFTDEFDKIAFVAIRGRQGIYAIDRNEQILFQVYNYEVFPDKITNGLFRIIENDKMGFANMDGQIVIEPQYKFVYPFQKNGYAIFCENGIWTKLDDEHLVLKGKWGAIDKKGTVIVSPVYDSGSENYLKKDGKRYRLNSEGELILK